jgi:hypothetical protein
MLPGAISSIPARARRRTTRVRFNSRTAKESLLRERILAVPRGVTVRSPSRSKASAYDLTLPGLTPIPRASLLIWISPVG